MPVYEYECSECRKTIEVQQKMVDAPLKNCPDCDGTLKKLVSMSSFQLKGGGWYADGYASTATSNAAGSAAPACGAASSGCKSCPAASAE